ncbi:MAG: RNA polymerase sigma factor [Planctomycetota bacterium]|jgi:RNA polymerase sigma-70 factor (ECF subfamily)
MSKDTEIGGCNNAFMNTPWTDILSMKMLSEEDRQEKLDSLFRRYWRPVYFFIRRKGKDNEEAKDLTQAFFARMIEVDIVNRADPEKGRFRSYLLTSVTRFVSSPEGKKTEGKLSYPKGTAFIRQMSSDDKTDIEPSHDTTPEKEFNRQWAISLLNNILTRLREMCESGNSPDSFTVFEKRLFGSASPYGANMRIADEMGIAVSEVEAHYKKALRWYRFLLRQEVAACVEKPSEIEDEIRDLWHILGQ